MQTFVLVASARTVHIGRGPSQVRYVPSEILHLGNLAQLPEYALTAAAHNLLALVGRYGAERTAAVASAVDGHRVAYHLICGNALAVIAGMGQTGVGQVIYGVKFRSGERRIGRVYHNILLTRGLYDTVRLNHV